MATRGISRNVLHIDEATGILSKLDGEFVSGTTHGTPDTETSHAHTLGRVPRGLIIIGQDKAASIYNGSTANTSSLIYVRSDIATVAFKAYVF